MTGAETVQAKRSTSSSWPWGAREEKSTQQQQQQRRAPPVLLLPLHMEKAQHTRCSALLLLGLLPSIASDDTAQPLGRQRVQALLLRGTHMQLGQQQ